MSEKCIRGSVVYEKIGNIGMGAKRLMKYMALITLIVCTVLVHTKTVHAGQAENIKACVKQADNFAHIKLNEFVGRYEDNWLSDDIVKWENARCDVKLQNVRNLIINGKYYVYKGFAGRAGFEFYEKLERKTENAIDQLETLKRNIEQRKLILESHLETASNYLKLPSPEFGKLEQAIDESIELSFQIKLPKAPKTQKTTHAPPSPSIKKPTAAPSSPLIKKPKSNEKSSDTDIGIFFVTSDELNERLQPRIDGKISNVIYRGQKVTVYEYKDGWARISPYYNQSVEGSSGTAARWVFAKYLSETKPIEKKVAVNSKLGDSLRKSDDFSKLKPEFLKASQKLIDANTCKISDFMEMGGWVRSSKHKPRHIYFTYCGGFHRDNRIYLEPATGRVFK
jgi:hypothetical protein